jgi:hypothetical protein
MEASTLEIFFLFPTAAIPSESIAVATRSGWNRKLQVLSAR